MGNSGRLRYDGAVGSILSQGAKIMTRRLCFWVLMLIWLIFGIWSAYPSYGLVGGTVMLFALLFLVGWQVFGPPISG